MRRPRLGAARSTVMLVLPRPDHVRGYRPLLHGLANDAVRSVVATSYEGARLLDTDDVDVRTCPFYLERGTASTVGWLRHLILRERAARAVVSTDAPAALIVPSDVSDATVAFVAASRRRRTPVIYVQGSVVFPNYPEHNAKMYAEQRWTRRWLTRTAVQVGRGGLAMAGIHATVGAKAVLGSRADLVCVMNERQAAVHRDAGVAAERIAVTGAPFIDGMLDLAKRFDEAARRGVRDGLGLDGRRSAVFVTKSLFRLGWATREEHEASIRAVLAAFRRELPDWVCVVKLHPMESLEDYAALVDGTDDAVRVVKEGPAEDLILASDFVLSLGASSPAFAARVFDRPLALVNFTATAMLDSHPDLTDAVPTFRRPEELEATLRAIRTDPTSLDRLRCAARDEWMDGRASARIADRVRSLMSR